MRPAADPTKIARVELLLRLVETEAELQLARGTPGAWGDVTRRCRSARGLLGADPACEPEWHIYLLELEAWGEVLAQVVRPEREDELVGALRRRAELEAPEDPEAWGRLLSLIHQGLRDPEGLAGAETFMRMELGFCRAMRAFRARPTVASLRACLAMILELVPTVSHNPCGGDTLTASFVLSETLTELLPLPYQLALARWVRAWFFKLHGASEELIYDGSVPHVLWQRLRKGEVVSTISDRLELTLMGREAGPPLSDPWFVEKAEGPVRGFDGWSGDELVWGRREDEGAPAP